MLDPLDHPRRANRPRRERRACAVISIVPALLVLAAAAPAPARERVVRVYDERDGLAVSEIAELAQDARGFIWIGTIGGLVRFDGAEMRPWAPDSVRHVIRFLATSPGGAVLVAALGEPLREVRGEGVAPLPGPRGGPVLDWVHAAFTGDDVLWLATADTLWRRAADGRWTPRAAAEFEAGPFYRVGAGRGDTALVATRAALWACPPSGSPRLVARIALAWQMPVLPDGGLAVITRDGDVWRIEAGRAALLLRGHAGSAGLVARGDQLWATVGPHVVRFDRGAPPDTVGPTPAVPPGRPLLVDREGTLWIGGYRGLVALPEPETVAWNEADGFPAPAHAHDLTRTAGEVWTITWYGATRLVTDPPPRRVVPIGIYSGRLVPDGHGRLWGADLDRGFICWERGRARRYPRPGLHGVYGGASRRDGSLWLATEDGAFLVPPDGGEPRPIASRPPADWSGGWTESGLGPLLEDRAGRLWLSCGDELLSAPADSVARGASVAWRRERIPDGARITDLVELPSGVLWAATSNAGVWRHAAAGWEAIPGNRGLASLRVYGMKPSPAGGVWVLAGGSLIRVRERPDLADGWEEIERLTAWQGLPTQQASDIAEDPDGRLWLATLAGLVEIPPIARREAPRPPRIELVDLRVDGRALPPDRPPLLPFGRNRIELRFAALTYRDRGSLRYESRLGPDRPWVRSSEPTILFADLAPGRYRAELRASLDGLHWGDASTIVPFRVARPWWQEPWALALALLAAGGVLFAAHRLRVAFLLRLERQRIRIAMDLHDELGSGLGSIGVLAGLAAGPRVDEVERRELAARIADTASELGGALSDIVTSLRSGADTLESLAATLAERGRRLMPGERPAFAVRLPAPWPAVRLAPRLRRELQLIAVEALHNAARHAGASRVELGLAPAAHGWRLWVDDDGVGLAPTEANGDDAGNGLRNMRARAESIGAAIEWRPAEGGGTRVELRFDPSSGRRPVA